MPKIALSPEKWKSPRDCFDRQETERKMRRLKLTALEAGLDTDFSFLIGPDADLAELMHCFKSDLIVSSDYFKGLLHSHGAQKPVVIKNVQPHIFKLLLRFVSFHSMEEVSVSTLADAVALGLAANEYKLEHLQKYCVYKIKKLVNSKNVWDTLNLTVQVPDLADACTEVLSEQTRQCLELPSFHKAAKESLTYFLKLDPLAIQSEMDLVDACIKFAESLPEVEGLRLMKAALPHLRLLICPMNKLGRLSKYLSDSEKLFLANQLIFNEKNPLPSLNSSTKSRSKPHLVLELIPREQLKSNWEMVGQKLGSKSKPRKLEIHLVARHNLRLKGMEILTDAHNFPDMEATKNAHNTAQGPPPIYREYKEDLEVEALVTLKSASRGTFTRWTIKEQKEHNSWFYLDLRNLLVPKEATCVLSVYTADSYQLVPHALFQEKIAQAAKCEALSQFGVVLCEQVGGSCSFRKQVVDDKANYMLNVKSLSLALVDEEKE